MCLCGVGGFVVFCCFVLFDVYCISRKIVFWDSDLSCWDTRRILFIIIVGEWNLEVVIFVMCFISYLYTNILTTV